MSVRKDIVSGVFWIAVARYSGIAIQLLITAILARLIAPAAFGTIAIAMVVLHFLNILADIGIGPAVVQYSQLSKSHLNSLFTLTIYIGVVLTLALYLSAGAIAGYYADATLTNVCRLMSLVILFQSLNIVPNALMRKYKCFRAIAFRTLFFQVVSGGIAVWGAFQGWGIYALLVSPILTAIGMFTLNYYSYPLQYVLRISNEAVKLVGSFSFFQFAYSFCNYFSRNLDKLIIGKYFSMTQLGYYDKSYHLMMLPLQNVSFVIEPVLHPVLSTLQDNKHELKEKNQKMAVLISNISFPIGLILFFCGGELIKIVYGGQWDAAIPVFRILALSLPLQMILSTSAPIYQSAGKTNHMFIVGLLNTFCTVFGFFIGALWGCSIEAMAWAWDISLAVNFFNSYFILHFFTLKETPILFYKALLPQFFNSIMTFGIVLIIISVLPEYNLFFSLFYKLFIVVSCNIGLAMLLKQYGIKEIAIKLIHLFKLK